MKKALLLSSAITISQLSYADVSAQTVEANTADLSAPVFQQVDPNGVDLINGYLRVSSPEISVGDRMYHQCG